MGRHKLPYNIKKPNQHNKYCRYVLSTDPHRTEISTKTKVKYEAKRIAKEVYQKEILEQYQRITFGRNAIVIKILLYCIRPIHYNLIIPLMSYRKMIDRFI